MLARRSFLGLMAGGFLPSAPFAATPSIVATTGMIADAAREMTGLPVTALIGPGMDPHGHRPTRSDILTLSRADLVLWHGLNLEAQFATLMAGLSQKTTVLAVAEALPADLLLSDPDYPDRPDPHVWFDPVLWSQVTQAMEPTLADFAPDVAAKGVAYRESVGAIGFYAKKVLDTIPAESRLLVTAHDAFSYFGRAFGLEVAGVQGISTDSEAGLSRIAALVDLLVNRRVPAVFVESSVSDRALRALIEGAAAKGHAVRIGGELFSDAMGPEGSYEGTWFGMMDHNATTIARALGGNAPERGALGVLGMNG
ncbi:metal ABC transporter solute-binding protein, Zn/Mn family [Pseudotabrizicola sp.]|nr:zinc ABC transporter substrate-binding protein [Pseudotabrizicola sp.]MDO8883272.1 zinc ABC transporter substrate-binding protein [Pseudotabrizicola sp.]MDP2082954.1 zinc ABC transporter substrate-binding protein [Pseudotabrizicola sp.]